jgi:hypothetical protein
MKNGHFLFVLVLALSLSGCAGTPTARPTKPAEKVAVIDDNKIIPGKRIGKVSVGMSIVQLLDVMGDPTKEYTNSNGSAASYEYGQLFLGVDHRDQSIASVSTTDSDYKTSSGLGVGSSELRVRAVMGQPLCFARDRHAYFLLYDGIVFNFRGEGITSIQVGDYDPHSYWSGNAKCR